MTKEKSKNNPDNLELWNNVCKTSPKHTKKVTFGRGFTAINPMSQIMSATKQFGPLGKDWWYTEEIVENTPPELLVIKVSLHHKDYEGSVVQYGTSMWKSGSKIDQDAPKKALTDGMTKCLSLLGFNADIFLGLWDDNKYVAEQLKAEKTTDDKNAPINQDMIDLKKLQKECYRMAKKFPIKQQTEFEDRLDTMTKTEANWIKAHSAITNELTKFNKEVEKLEAQNGA